MHNTLLAYGTCRRCDKYNHGLLFTVSTEPDFSCKGCLSPTEQVVWDELWEDEEATVHGGMLERETSDPNLHPIQPWILKISPHINGNMYALPIASAIVLGGSSDMQDSRELLIEENIVSAKDIYYQHSLLQHRKRRRENTEPFCLLATESFYNGLERGRYSVEKFVIFDDCEVRGTPLSQSSCAAQSALVRLGSQVHRMCAYDFAEIGLCMVLKTYLIDERELNRRKLIARNRGLNFVPRVMSLEGNPHSVPPWLTGHNSACAARVTHPLIGFPLIRPSLFKDDAGGLKYNPPQNKEDKLSMNEMPIAHLLWKAVGSSNLSQLERSSLILLVCASQTTQSLPHLFAFARRSLEEGNEPQRVNESVLLRAFLSGGGHSNEEVGLTILYLLHSTNIKSKNPGSIKLHGETLLHYIASPYLANFKNILNTLLHVMDDLFKKTLT